MTSIRPLHSLKYQGLVADDEARRHIGVEFTALESPTNLGDPRVGANVAFHVDVISFLDPEVTQFAA